MSDLSTKLLNSVTTISTTNVISKPVTSVSNGTDKTESTEISKGISQQSASNTPISQSLISAIIGTKSIINSGGTATNPRPSTTPYDPVTNDDSISSINRINLPSTNSNSAPVIKNVYGSSIDIQNARRILGTVSYNYIETDQTGFVVPILSANDIVLGGAQVSNIPDDKLNGATRLAGANRNETIKLIRDYADTKNVYGTGTDLENAKAILGATGYNYILTDSINITNLTLTSNDIVLGGVLATGIADYQLNGAIRLAGENRYLTAQSINNYNSPKYVYSTMVDI